MPGKWNRGIHLFCVAEKVFKTLKEIQEVTFAEVPVMKCCPPSRQVVASLEISGVRVQVYKGADQATLQALLQAAKSC